MSSGTIQSAISFLVDRKGRKTHAVLPIGEYERMVENEYDNAVADSRKNDGTVSLEEFKKRIGRRQIRS